MASEFTAQQIRAMEATLFRRFEVKAIPNRRAAVAALRQGRGPDADLATVATDTEETPK